MTKAESLNHLINVLDPKDGKRYAVVTPPKCYEEAVEYAKHRSLDHKWELALRGKFEGLVFFITRESELNKKIPKLFKHIDSEVYVVWPKGQSNIVHDVTREAILKHFEEKDDFKFVKGFFFDANWRAILYKRS
jgi:hypothetical protein